MSAGKRTSAADDSARPATSADTDPTPSSGSPDVSDIARELGRQAALTGTRGNSGSTTGRSELASEFPISGSSDGPSRGSTRPFRQPKNVREFAAQANRVATSILNGEIDLDTARAYSAVARTVAQAVTAQTVHARFLKTKPDLDFPEEDE